MTRIDPIRARNLAILAALALGAALAGGACGEDLPSDQTSSPSSSSGSPTSSSTSGGGEGGGGMGGAGGGGGSAPDCFTNPMTHVEIINACTNAEEVDKKPVLPLLGANGKLPPLP